MNRSGKLMLAMCAGALMVVASGCGGSSHPAPVGATPTIVVVNGYRGYYLNNVFCDWANNYCGTGNAYGIALPTVIYYNGYYGYYNNSVFCDWTNDYCGTGISWGIIDNGTYCDYTYCGGTVSWSTGSYSGSTGGSYSGSTGGSYSGSTGGSYSGSTGGSYSGSTGGSYSGSTGGSYSGSTGGSYSGSTGSYSGSTGSYSGSTGSYSGSTGSYSGSTGSYSGSTGSSSSSSTGSSYSGSTGTSGSTGSTYSVSGQTKDVDLQAAQLQIATIQARAVALSQQFGMSVDSAVQVTQLADRMKAVTSGGKQMTAEDQAALLDAAYGVAGVSADAVNAAAANYIKSGNQSAVNDLLNQAAAHMGMSNTAALRDQILPSLGIHLTAK